MKDLLRGLRVTGLFLLLMFVGLTLMDGSHYENLKPAEASPSAQSTPTCPAPPAGCLQERVYDYQPYRYSVRSVFTNAAGNNLGNQAPTFDQIAHGLPITYGGTGITYENVTVTRPIPHIILRGVAWQESLWKQFADNMYSDPDGGYFCTLVSDDCGYGLMQITSGMGGGAGFDPAWDFLYVRLLDTNGDLITTVYTVTNQSARDLWQTDTFDLWPYLSQYVGQSVDLSFEATTDGISDPTSFFVDDVSLAICQP